MVMVIEIRKPKNYIHKHISCCSWHNSTAIFKICKMIKYLVKLWQLCVIVSFSPVSVVPKSTKMHFDKKTDHIKAVSNRNLVKKYTCMCNRLNIFITCMHTRGYYTSDSHCHYIIFTTKKRFCHNYINGPIVLFMRIALLCNYGRV